MSTRCGRQSRGLAGIEMLLASAIRSGLRGLAVAVRMRLAPRRGRTNHVLDAALRLPAEHFPGARVRRDQHWRIACAARPELVVDLVPQDGLSCVEHFEVGEAAA